MLCLVSAACSVSDPSLHSSFDGPKAAKYLTVLKQEKYFPDIIDSKAFAAASAYFALGDPKSGLSAAVGVLRKKWDLLKRSTH